MFRPHRSWSLKREGVIGLLSIGFLAFFYHSRISYPTLPVQNGQMNRIEVDPLDLTLVGPSWRNNTIDELNRVAIESLQKCLKEKNCRPNQDKVILANSDRFDQALEGQVAGENIWANSLMDASHQIGYTVIYCRAFHPEIFYEHYRMFADQIKIILMEPNKTPWCIDDPKCADPIPDGPYRPPDEDHLYIPQWKIFTMYFFDDAVHPLGGNFTLNAVDYGSFPMHKSEDNFLGYSIESYCLQNPVIPWEERYRRAYVYAKTTKYFTEDKFFMPTTPNGWGNHTRTPVFEHAASYANASFVGSFRETDVTVRGVRKLPKLDRVQFTHELSMSRLIVGVGLPYVSPSPWAALCVGVPFLCPVESWDHENPDDITKWRTQHDGILYAGLKEPYVYWVKRGDEEGFKRAVKSAMDTPIGRYIPKHMQMPELIKRLTRLVEYDWRPVAQQIIQDRKKLEASQN